MYSDIYLNLPSSLFSCLRMFGLSVKFTVTTQIRKMQFIFLQLGLVLHESLFLLLQENCQLQDTQMIWHVMLNMISLGVYTQFIQGTPPSSNATVFPGGDLGPQMRGFSAVFFPAPLPWLPPILCSNCCWGLHMCSSQWGPCALGPCEDHKDPFGMTYKCSGGPLPPKASHIRHHVGHRLPHKACRSLLFSGS